VDATLATTEAKKDTVTKAKKAVIIGALPVVVRCR